MPMSEIELERIENAAFISAEDRRALLSHIREMRAMLGQILLEENARMAELESPSSAMAQAIRIGAFEAVLKRGPAGD